MRAAGLLLPALLALGARAEEPSCTLPPAQQVLTQRALDAWERASRDLLRTSPTPLPWIVLIGPHCSWHLAPAPDAASFYKEALALSGGREVLPGWVFAGETVPVVAVPHDGQVRLPDGRRVPAKPVGMATMRRDRKQTFLAISTLELWRGSDLGMSEADLQDFFVGGFTHEIVHTRYLVALAKEFARIARMYSHPPSFDEYDVERKLGKLRKKRGYAQASQAECDLLFRAAAERDEVPARELAAEALRLAIERRGRWLTGRRAWLGEFEQLDLFMEGLAEWCRYRLLTEDPAESRSDAQLLTVVRFKNHGWARDEGLALFLVLDRLAPGWQVGLLDGVPRSPFDLLAEAIQRRMPA